jgi:hypothetical protein
VPVTLGGIKQPVDLYRMFNLLADLNLKVREEFPDAERDLAKRQMAYTDQLRLHLFELGFTNPVSDRAIDKFDGAIRAGVVELKKTDAVAPTPG